MQIDLIARLVEGTADAAFIIDDCGVICAWNQAAHELIGLSAAQVLARPCAEVLQGSDEEGTVCSERCVVRRAIEANSPVVNFDLRLRTTSGPQWCNISMIIVTDSRYVSRYALHIIRPRQFRKQLEILLRDFIVAHTGLGPEAAARLMATGGESFSSASLTPREREVLKWVAQGKNTADIAGQLNISRTTVRNHINHILAKLDAHTRLEAVRRAERARLIPW